ncbi:MAG: 2-amino-4-hydroxy-6-hydroxymethyldihydropteridine diphosphokinase [Proteobacteria bacterium]|nr:2-amino-4-hydroxy-6-hydroxymethyldihydropteridine diphosphokinase [Pseudomonadota bacterium]MBU1686998.1 2-amino-4-hydroxy-6-hydroxymethyldihydropteridine diphosphokinase [Pseudomonadota bacterium]
MALVFIGLGSNQGDGSHNLRQAWRDLGLASNTTLLALSSPYLTRPIYKAGWLESGKTLAKQWFTNAVGVLEYRGTPDELLGLLLSIEGGMGRQRGESFDRPVDLDILYFDTLTMETDALTIPHPAIQDRLFVLAPMEELAPEHHHPVLALTTAQMRRNLPPESAGDVRKTHWDERESP